MLHNILLIKIVCFTAEIAHFSTKTFGMTEKSPYLCINNKTTKFLLHKIQKETQMFIECIFKI